MGSDAGPPGGYLGLGAGLNFVGDSDISGGGIDTRADFKAGWASAATLGYRFTNGLRGELEVGYRDNDVDSLSGVSSADGRAKSVSFMGNLLYDFNLEGRIKPYLGFGIGGIRGDFDAIQPIGENATRLDDRDEAFAAQAILGASFEVDDRMDLFLDYRYFRSNDLELRTDSGVAVDAEYRNQTVMLGVRLALGKTPEKPAPAPAAPVPAPAPEPPPAPEIAKTYLVFFDWDRSDLTPEALKVLQSAAENALAGKPTRIVATGHADRSGPDAYNLGLSRRRAESVQAELIRLGVPAAQIGIDWKGERDPLVETPDGVREPQNRRVEIVFD
jgi:outer membrane protein OmpA-like peptidoglycan-associated protein